jgi:ribosomal RNA-processing protein 1
MTDRPRPQQALATDLASLIFDLQRPCVAPFCAGFWSVLSKQWSSIDALRMDKFLLLVRRVFGAHVRYERESRWRGGLLEVLETKCFDVREEEGVALGLRLHVLDLWVDEMEKEKALGDDEDEERLEWVRRVGGFVDALKASPVKAVRTRARDSHDDERLPWATAREDEEQSGEDGGEEGEDEDEGWGGIRDD